MVLLPESKISAHIILIIDNIKTIWYARISPFPYAPIYATFSFLCMFGRRDVPFAAWSVPIGIQAGAEQQNGQRTQDTGKKLSQNRESLFVKFFFLWLKMSLQSSTTVLDDVHLCQIWMQNELEMLRTCKYCGNSGTRMYPRGATAHGCSFAPVAIIRQKSRPSP